MNRRSLIALSGAFGASCAIGHRFARSAAGGYPFTLGVASGQPSSDGFVIWTRLAVAPLAPDGLGGMSEPASVRWEVAADDVMRKVVRTGTQEAHGRWGHCVHVEVSGLEPGRPYWYRFIASGEASPVGLARTAPAPGTKLASMRFAFASCSNWQHGYFSAYRHMAAENPDLVIFLGDYIYERTVGPSAPTVLVLRSVPRVRAATFAGHASASRDKVFVAYSGKRVVIVHPGTGVVHDAELFVGVLHLCRGDVHADAAGLDRRACAHVPLLQRRAAADRAGQPQERRSQSLAGDQSQLRHNGRPLWRRRASGASAKAARQGQGRSRRALTPAAGTGGTLWPASVPQETASTV